MRCGWLLGVILGGVILGGIAASEAQAAGPEVSRSRGRGGGVVVLWPRVVPETEDPTMIDLARRLQQRLADSATVTIPTNRVDLRPAPERVCPRAGCKATSLSLMLGHQDGGCALIALVGPPGPETQRLIPLVGRFQMDEPYLPFRTPPEGEVIVTEFVPCGELEQRLDPAALGLLLPTASPQGAPASPAPASPTP